MRIKTAKEYIDYSETKNFFCKRAGKYNEETPYVVTMYNDNHPDLVEERNKKEVSILIPWLSLDDASDVLDIACGIGRWCEQIVKSGQPIHKYVGIDFCEDFINLAKKRNPATELCQSKKFYVGKTTDTLDVLKRNDCGKFNRVIIVGALMYLNDKDMKDSLQQIETACSENTRIIIREPIGIETRLTLKEEYSGELDDNYNAIYRTRDELYDFFSDTFLRKGFCLLKEGFLFDDSKLNNRKETAQYFFVLERTKDSKVE